MRDAMREALNEIDRAIEPLGYHLIDITTDDDEDTILRLVDISDDEDSEIDLSAVTYRDMRPSFIERTIDRVRQLWG